MFTDDNAIEIEGGFRKLKNSLLAMIVLPLILIVPGAFLGGWSWTTKVWALQIGTWLAVLFLLGLAKKRLLIGTEIAALLEKKTGWKAIKEGLEDYFKVVAAILASEITVGLISLWLPAHQDPKMFFLLFLVIGVIVFYRVWKGGAVWWPKVVYKMAIFTLFTSLAIIMFPATSEEISNRLRLDEKISGVVKTTLPLPGEVAVQRQAQATSQIYPDYMFQDGETSISVPLIPINQVLSRQAGGWVTVPPGAEYRIDYNVPIVIEYNDGRKSYRKPNSPAYDGIRLANGMFRIYGEQSEHATITIRRKAYGYM